MSLASENKEPGVPIAHYSPRLDDLDIIEEPLQTLADVVLHTL